MVVDSSLVVELASARGFTTNTRATRSKRGFLRVLLLLSSLISLMCATCAGVHPPALTRSRRSHPGAKHKGAYHRPLTDEQEADQNLQFMLSLYQSAAEPDGRLKQHRKFGSNMVRLVRPSASSVRRLPASRDHRYSFTVQYNVDTLPSEQLIRASFVHLRSSSWPSTSSSAASGSAQAPELPRCRALITPLGKESLVTLEPHERWTETDITAHVQRGKDQGAGSHLTLTALYWCTEHRHDEEDRGVSRRWTRLQRRKRWGGKPHLEVPSLLLYLEEDREVTDWMADLLGTEGETFLRRIGQFHSSVLRRRHRRSKDFSKSERKVPPLDALKHALSSSSSSSFSASATASIVSDIPYYKRKTSVPANRCKLHSYPLYFDTLNLSSYFIAPPWYDPHFCQGDCPRVLTYDYHSPNHAIFQTVINELGVGGVPAPSCVPYKYMPMSVLVVDNNNRFLYKELEDMLAKSCTCR